MAELTVLKDPATLVSGDGFGAYGSAATLSPGFNANDHAFAAQNGFSLTGNTQPDNTQPQSSAASGNAITVNPGLPGFNANDDTFAAQNGFSLTNGNTQLDKLGLEIGGDVISQTAKNVPLSEMAMTTRPPIESKKDWSPKFAVSELDPPWSRTYRGRIWMRLISRGVFGTLAYAIAGRYVDSKLNVDIHTLTGEERHDGYRGGRPESKEPLAWISYGIDMTLGKLIYGLSWLFTFGSAARAKKNVMFRSTRDYGYGERGLRYKSGIGYGRGLGQEMVAVTTDFAAMSTADYAVRKFLNYWDPHVRKREKARKEAETRSTGKIIWDKLAAIPKATLDVFLNGPAADIWTALPYVYYMRFQRHFLNQLSPGFEMDSNNGRWGGSAKVARDASGNYQFVGNYNLEGILDFTGRFTFYNIMVKFYRDLYANLQVKFYNRKHHIHTEEDAKKEHLTLLQKVKHFTKYMVVTSTNVSTYMVPSSFIFGVLRTSQGKHRGLLISAEEDPNNPGGRPGRIIDPTKNNVPLADVEYGHQFSYSNYMYRAPNKPPSINVVTNPLGATAARFTDGFKNSYNFLLKPFGWDPDSDKMKLLVGKRNADGVEEAGGSIAERHGEAAFAYLPYLWSSGDVLSNFYDTTRSKFVLSGLYDSAGGMAKALFSLQGPQVKKAWNGPDGLREWMGEASLALLKQPSPKHEAEIRERMKRDDLKRASVEAHQLDRGYYLKAGESEEKAAKQEMSLLKNWMPDQGSGNIGGTSVAKNNTTPSDKMTVLINSTPPTPQQLMTSADRQAMQQLQSQNVPATSLSSVTAGGITPGMGNNGASLPNKTNYDKMTMLINGTPPSAQELQASADKQAMQQLLQSQSQNVPTTTLNSANAGGITLLPGTEPVGAR